MMKKFTDRKKECKEKEEKISHFLFINFERLHIKVHFHNSLKSLKEIYGTLIFLDKIIFILIIILTINLVE